MTKLGNTRYNILPIEQTHTQGFWNCLDSVAKEEDYLRLLQAPSLTRVKEFVTQNIAQNIPQFVALYENTVVGWCDILPNTMTGFTHCGAVGMGVHRAHRRCGIGKALLTTTIAKAKCQGIERIELEVYATNTSAIKLYHSLGFQKEGRKQHARKWKGNTIDILLMAKFIPPTMNLFEMSVPT